MCDGGNPFIPGTVPVEGSAAHWERIAKRYQRAYDQVVELHAAEVAKNHVLEEELRRCREHHGWII